MPDRPNFLMIMADQLPARTIGAYGHPIVRTPHLDALARRGVLFRSAYTNCPICAPSRASMCAGRLVSEIGTFDNGSELPASTPTFLHWLRREGYATVLSGKMHFIGPDQHHGFERRLTTDIYPASFVWTPDWRRGAYANPGTAVDQLREAGPCTWSMQLDYDEEVAFRATEALRDLARNRRDRPFFLCASFTHPHDPFIISREWWNLYDHDAIDMPSAPPPTAHHPYDAWLQVHHRVVEFPPREEDIRNARHAFYAMTSYFDAKVGALLAELDRLGLAGNTIVLVTSDHGEMLGEHGMWFKRTYFDPATRIPLIAAGPGIADGLDCAETVSLVDLFPTFLDLASVDGREEALTDGDSLAGLLRGDRAGWKESAIGEYYSEGVRQPMRMAVGGGCKYVYVHEEQPLLFDLARDPHETRNVIGDPAYGAALARLRRLVHDGWDPEATRARVLASQRARMLISAALANGRPAPSWDARPDFDPAEQYVRREDGQRTNARLRFPRFGE